MKNNDWYDLGEQIRDVVQSAVESKDFSQLNQTVNEAINRTMEGVKKYYNQTGESYRRYPNREIQGNFKKANYSTQLSRTGGYDITRFARNPHGRIAGPLMAILGFSFGGIFGMTALLVFFTGLAIHEPSAVVTGAVFGVVAVAGIVTGIRGSFLWKRISRFKKYIRKLAGREFCSLSELLSVSGMKKKPMLRDLERMIDEGMFLQGHIDEQQTCLMVTESSYQQYLAAQQELKKRQRQETAKQNEQSDSESSALIREGNDYIRRIRQANDAIPGEVMSTKLDRLETIMTRIFHQVKKHPENAKELHRFMTYYLPTTTKLIDAYRELDAQPVAGENISGTKKEIEETLDTINTAFENLLDRFFQDTAWDITSDISVMKTMMEQEGLVENGPTMKG